MEISLKGGSGLGFENVTQTSNHSYPFKLPQTLLKVMKITIEIPDDQAVFMKQLLDRFAFVTTLEMEQTQYPAATSAELLNAFPILKEEANVRVSNILDQRMN